MSYHLVRWRLAFACGMSVNLSSPTCNCDFGRADDDDNNNNNTINNNSLLVRVVWVAKLAFSAVSQLVQSRRVVIINIIISNVLRPRIIGLFIMNCQPASQPPVCYACQFSGNNCTVSLSLIGVSRSFPCPYQSTTKNIQTKF